MGKFNLSELLNERSKDVAAAESSEAAAKDKAGKLMLDVFDITPSETNFYSTDTGIDRLKMSIEIVGLLEPLVVRETGEGYTLISGHRRRLALMSLVNEGKERFRYAECTLKESGQGKHGEILDRLAEIMANDYRDKTDYERMTETIKTEELVIQLKEDMKIGGRTRDLLAEILKSTAAQVGRYKAIYNNLSPELMELFKADEIGVSAIYEACGLSEKGQLTALETYKEKGDLSINDVKRIKGREDKEPTGADENQTAADDAEIGETTAADDEPPITEDEAGEGTPDEHAEEYIDPAPETMLSICYSCTKYEDCHDKKATVTDCNAYVNRQEAYKTDEQRYNEEQAAIDRETKRKLREIEDGKATEETYPPIEETEHQEVRLAPRTYGEIVDNHQRFLLLKSDGFKAGENLTIPEYSKGEPTDREIEIKITQVIEESGGLNVGYCIIGFRLVWWSD